MKVLTEIGLLMPPDVRGLIYLASFVQAGVVPSVVITHGGEELDLLSRAPVEFWERHIDLFDYKLGLGDYLFKYGIEQVVVAERSVNSDELRAAVLEREESVFIFSGGGVIKPPLLNIGKRFIHIHPGSLPDYRGSTCFYYSMIKDSCSASSAFFMEPSLDTGALIAKKTFEVPTVIEEDVLFFDLIYDPWIRGALLSEILSAYSESGEFTHAPQEEASGGNYYIIHPILKNIAIEKFVKKD